MTRNTGVLAVVIPAFNAERFIGDAISSVLEQGSVLVECVIIDDGSTDRTAEVAKSFCGAGPVRVISQPNRGVSAARNMGADATAAPLLSFLDADDAWFPDRSWRLVKELNREFDAVVSATLVTDSELQPMHIQGVSRIPSPTEILENACAPVSVSSNAVIRRSAFERVGGFDERLSSSADWELFLKLAASCRLTALNEPLTQYRRHPAAMSRSIDLMDHDLSLIYKEVFAGRHAVPRDLASRRDAFAAMHWMLAGSYADTGSRAKALWEVVSAMRWRPGIALKASRGLAKQIQASNPVV